MNEPLPRRAAIAVLAAVALGALVWWLFIYDPFDGKEQHVHESDPVFNVLYKPKPVKVVKPRGDELLRMRTRRGKLDAVTTVRNLELPAYEGDVAGVFPIVADARTRATASQYDDFRLTVDTRSRVHDAPAYQVAFTYTEPGVRGEGIDLMVVPRDEEQPRAGVLLQMRLTKPLGRNKRRLRKAARAMRSALRSFQFGADRY